ncbi:MAG: Rnase Y domain-containing protein [Anaerolineae bacterium]|nr:Rnase Y domain-containing protein [Anaerolineae bacterium]MDK1080584.1 Rnase Y domain-containing protein [Anaerolineae bacterium]MDK1117830.1 Rnase Y domain-containing protein [Anaerolineae bacterium]
MESGEVNVVYILLSAIVGIFIVYFARRNKTNQSPQQNADDIVKDANEQARLIESEAGELAKEIIKAVETDIKELQQDISRKSDLLDKRRSDLDQLADQLERREQNLDKDPSSGGKGRSASVPQSFYRVRKDNPPRMLVPGWKFKKMHWEAPETHKLRPTKNSAHGSERTRLSPWENFLRSLNDTDKKWIYYINDHSGLFNNTGWDKQETIVMGNNVVVVDEIQQVRNGWMARVKTLFIENSQPDPYFLNYESSPWLIHKFTVITRKGFVIDPKPGAILYPLITNKGDECWIELEKLEKFPSLPLTVTVKSLGLNVREKPTLKSTKITAIRKGTPIKITQYLPVGSEIWAQCEQGWIALYHPDSDPKYLTSWKMQTDPPPP